MRVFYFGNNRVGAEVLHWLRAQGENIVGVALHPRDKRAFGEELCAAIDCPPDVVFDAARLREPETLARIAALEPDIGVSVSFGYILKPELLDLFPRGVVNLHPSYLPFNRGAYPNVWSILKGTPAGVTLHYVDEGVDTGDIIAQQAVCVEATDTGATLYRKLEATSVALFQQTWPHLRTGTAPRRPQPPIREAAHRVRDVDARDEIDLNRQYTGRELLNILRARTFAPHPGAYFRDGERKIYLRLELVSEETL